MSLSLGEWNARHASVFIKGPASLKLEKSRLIDQKMLRNVYKNELNVLTIPAEDPLLLWLNLISQLIIRRENVKKFYYYDFHDPNGEYHCKI
jgi:hypothetical protein